MRFPFFRNRDSVKNGILISIRRTGDGFHPGLFRIGYRYEQENFSLITNYSILKPDITKPYIVSGDTRYEVAKELLAGYDKDFSVNDAFKVLKSVSQKDLWATRVSFVYSTEKNKVYYVLNNDFSNVFEFQF